MRYFRLVVLTILTAIVVALTYYCFEYVVRHSITYIWDDLFGSDNNRWLVVPLCIGLTLAYFGVRHRLDPKSEHDIGHSLGDIPKATVMNYLQILTIGFLSLVAGASLGPEAVLVPACFVAGAFIGQKLMGSDKTAVKLGGIIGFIALFTAFFHSFVIGMLALLLVKKQFKISLTPGLIILAAIAASVTVFVLSKLDSGPYMQLPEYSWTFNVSTILALAAITLAGYATTFAIRSTVDTSQKLTDRFDKRAWWIRGAVAGGALAVLYLLGGELVQFTGNESIIPMFHQAAELGLTGLVWIFIIKVVAIGWSHAAGYRGGMIFPTIFLATILIAIAQLYESDLNLIYGLIAALVGIFAAEGKAKILT